MNIGYFDCFSGISGDMVLGALVDAGCDLGQLEAQLRLIPISGWTISAEKVSRKGLAATRVHVECAEQHHHRSLSIILKLIQDAGLSDAVKSRASRIFQRLGEAEARVHGSPIEKIHFHEVGAVDAIVDIVGAAIGFEMLGIDEFACSPLNVGGGRVETQHGTLPVPAPATADLLRDAPTYSSGILRELVTPTGAAIVSTAASHFGAQPAIKVRTIGYGAGAAELKEQANVLRLLLGEGTSPKPDAGAWNETAVVLETNLDDMNPQLLGYFVDRAFEAGALDVFFTPVQMKKNRPGQLVTVLCSPDKCEVLTELIFRETTTLGVRRSNVQRRTLRRDRVTVETKIGRAGVKIARLNGQILNAVPEYEDCQKIAADYAIPLKQVMAEVMFEFQKLQMNNK
jgi:uncharacterized protein (TIGR00299 family) protein